MRRINKAAAAFLSYFLFLGFTLMVGSIADVSAQDSSMNLTSEGARKIIPQAASIPNKEFEEFLTKGNAPGFEELESQPLSMVLISKAAGPKKDKAGPKPHFAFLKETVDPVEIVRVMWRTKSKGYATIIQPGLIDKCTVTTKNAVAKGTVEFKAKDLYVGKVLFTAKFQEGEWKITEFSLPNNKMKIVLNEKGKWRVRASKAKD